MRLSLLCLGILFPALGFSQVSDVGRPIAARMGEDVSGHWSWDEAWLRSEQFREMKPANQDMGFSSSVFWFRWDWTAQGAAGRFLAYATLPPEHVTLRFREGDRWGPEIRIGAYDTLETPWKLTRAVPLPEQGTVLVRVTSTNSIYWHLTILDAERIETLTSVSVLLYGLCLGFLTILGVVALFVAFRLKDKLFFWYAPYAFSLLPMLALYSGVLDIWIHDLGMARSHLDIWANSLPTIAALLFARVANNVERSRWINAGGTLVIAVMVVGLALHTAGLPRWGNSVYLFVLLVSSLGIETLAIVQAIRGVRFSRYFAVGWTVLVLSASALSLGSTGLSGPWQDQASANLFLEWGILFENLVLATALADRVSSLRRELDRQRDKAAVADRLASVGLLAARVGHEINSPNHVIRLNTALLEAWGSHTEAEARVLVAQIKDASRQIERVTQSLRTSLPRVVPGPVDLTELARAAIRMYGATWSQKTHRLSLRWSGTPVPVAGVEHRLHQLLVNLINNATEALPRPDAGVAVHVDFGTPVVLTVTDEGVGMPPEVLQRLGQPFFSTRAGQGGTGLGWSLCQDIAREHGALIEVSSQPGVGTTVTVRFPTDAP